MEGDDRRPIFLGADSGEALGFLSVTHKLTSRQTGGTCYLFVSEFEPGTGNRLHVHRHEIEIGCVLEGALEVRLADETRALEAGGIAFLPKRVPHAIRNPLARPSRYLFMTVPGGLDHFFDALARARDEGALDDAMHRRLSSDHGIDWLE